jgi:hypothetical protein
LNIIKRGFVKSVVSYSAALTATLLASLAFASTKTSPAIQKKIETEAKGAGYSVVDSKKVQTLEGNSIYFTKPGGSVERAILKLSGTLGKTAVDLEIDAKDLAASKTCAAPCASLDSDKSREALICTGQCSYGAPLLIGSDATLKQAFIAVVSEPGRVGTYTIYAFAIETREATILGDVTASNVDHGTYEAKSKTLTVVSSERGSKSTAKFKFPPDGKSAR